MRATVGGTGWILGAVVVSALAAGPREALAQPLDIIPTPRWAGGSPTPPVLLRRLRLPGPVRAVVASIDPTRVDLFPATATGGASGYARLTQVAAREDALLALNGDLAAPNRPARPIVRDGRLVTSGSDGGAVLALDPSASRMALVIGRPMILVGPAEGSARFRVRRWNAGLAPGSGLSAFTAAAGDPPWSADATCAATLQPSGTSEVMGVEAIVCGLEPLAAPSGEGLLLVASARSAPGRWLASLRRGRGLRVRFGLGLSVAEQAFGGSPVLVHHGRAVSGEDLVGPACTPLRCELHPRTAVGGTRGCTDRAPGGCRVLLVVVDGRRPGWSVGMTTDQLARLMVRLGAEEAVNLDGGASSQLLLLGANLNRPAPGARRAVVNALIVRGDRSDVSWSGRALASSREGDGR